MHFGQSSLSSKYIRLSILYLFLKTIHSLLDSSQKITHISLLHCLGLIECIENLIQSS